MKSNWAMVMAAKPQSRSGFARVARASGWGGGYKRKPPSGEHKCLGRAEMAALMRSAAFNNGR